MDWKNKLDNWLFYKYRPHLDDDERDLGLLRNNKVWFENPTNFNDPFDCFPVPSIQSRKEAINEIERSIVDKSIAPTVRSKIKERYETDPTGIIDETRNRSSTIEGVRNNMSRILVFSLAKKPLNRLMWSHYSSNHRGFAIEFNIDRMKIKGLAKNVDAIEVINNTFLPYPVIYQNERPVSYDNISKDQSPLPLVTKDKIWEYEEEYRILRLGQRGLVEFDPMGLSAVILGACVTPNTKAKIQDTVYEVNKNRCVNVEIYYAELSKYKFDLHIPGHPFYENR